MEHWQQTFLRTDPWQSIPFADQSVSAFGIDSIVGCVCVLCVVVVGIWG